MCTFGDVLRTCTPNITLPAGLTVEVHKQIKWLAVTWLVSTDGAVVHTTRIPQ
jgi:hypothetical protein